MLYKMGRCVLFLLVYLLMDNKKMTLKIGTPESVVQNMKRQLENDCIVKLMDIHRKGEKIFENQDCNLHITEDTPQSSTNSTNNSLIPMVPSIRVSEQYILQLENMNKIVREDSPRLPEDSFFAVQLDQQEINFVESDDSYNDPDFDPLSELSETESKNDEGDEQVSTQGLGTVKRVLQFDTNQENQSTKSESNSDKSTVRAFIDIYESLVTVEIFKILHLGIYKVGLTLRNRDNNTFAYTCFISEKDNPCKSHECVCACIEQQNVCIIQRSSTTEIEIQVNYCLETGTYLSGQEQYFIPTESYIAIMHIPRNKPEPKKLGTQKKIHGSKRHHCLYCNKLVSHISRHILTVHKEKEEVKEIMDLSIENKSIRLKKLRLRGDKLYNMQVPSTLRIPMRRGPDVQSTAHSVMCPECNGYISRVNFSRHYKKCAGKPFDGQHVTKQALLTMSEKVDPAYWGLNTDDKLARDLMARLKTDRIGCVATTDKTIQLLAKRSAKLHHLSRESCRENDISNIRRAARLLITLQRKYSDIKELKDIFRPHRYRELVWAVRSICHLERGYNAAPNEGAKPGLALQYGCLISRIIEILIVNNSERSDICDKEKNGTHDMLKKLKYMHSMEYRTEVSRNALDQNSLRRLAKSTVLPNVEDIRLFTSYINNMAIRSYKILIEKGFDKNEYRSLLESVLCQLLVFNRRRVGEMSCATLQDFQRKKQIEEEQLRNMTRYESIMAKHFTCMFILGKRSNVVPVLINPQQIIYLNYIVEHRSLIGIPDSNKYLFAYPNKYGHVDASTVLRNYSKECGATRPSTIRGTYLRRQVATLSQLLVLDDNSIQELADYMGHTVDVHKEYYRRPELTQQVTKLARFFSVITEEDMSQYRGKTIFELEPFIPDPDFDLDDLPNNEQLNNEEDNSNFNQDNLTEVVSDENDHQDNEVKIPGTSGRCVSPINISPIHTPPSTPRTPSYSPLSAIGTEETVQTRKNVTPKKQLTPSKPTTAELLDRIHKQGTPKKFRMRKLWTAKESALLYKIFGKHIKQKQLPSMEFCCQVLKTHRKVFLEHRNAQKVYSWVQYRIKNNKQRI